MSENQPEIDPTTDGDFVLVRSGFSASGVPIVLRRQTGPVIYTGGHNADGTPTRARIKPRLRSFAL